MKSFSIVIIKRGWRAFRVKYRDRATDALTLYRSLRKEKEFHCAQITISEEIEKTE